MVCLMTVQNDTYTLSRILEIIAIVDFGPVLKTCVFSVGPGHWTRCTRSFKPSTVHYNALIRTENVGYSYISFECWTRLQKSACCLPRFYGLTNQEHVYFVNGSRTCKTATILSTNIRVFHTAWDAQRWIRNAFPFFFLSWSCFRALLIMSNGRVVCYSSLRTPL